MYRQLFFIEGKLLGETDRRPVMYAGGVRPPGSHIWFCGVCGEVYAKAPVILPSGKPAPWDSHRKLCRRCVTPYESEVPGSLWLSWEAAFILALPMPVLKWELDRHIENIERIRNEQ